MSWLQFIDSMVGRVAWPIVVLVVIVAGAQASWLVGRTNPRA